MIVHPLQPFLMKATLAWHAARARNFPGTLAALGDIMRPVGALWATDQPRTPEARAEWDRHAGPVIARLRACQEEVERWKAATGRRGVTVNLAWLAGLIDESVRVLSLPGLESLFADPTDTEPKQPATDAPAAAGG